MPVPSSPRLRSAALALALTLPLVATPGCEAPAGDRGADLGGSPRSDGGNGLPPEPLSFRSHAFALAGTPTTLAAGDIDGDGKSDLVVNRLGGLSFLRSDGDGGFATPTELALPTTPRQAVTGDINEN